MINREHGHITSIDGFEILDGVPEAIQILNSKHIITVIVTNQSGIARGLLSVSGLETIHEHLGNELLKESAEIDRIYFSPWHPDENLANGVKKWLGDHEDRKPNAGMINKAMKHFQLSPSEVCMIGDSGKDQQAAKKAGVKFFGVRSSKQEEIDNSSCELFDSLLDVVNYLKTSKSLAD